MGRNILFNHLIGLEEFTEDIIEWYVDSNIVIQVFYKKLPNYNIANQLKRIDRINIYIH